MRFNVSFTVNGRHIQHCIEYGRTPAEAKRRALRSICKSYRVAECDVRIGKISRMKG